MSAFALDHGAAAAALRELRPGAEPIVAYVGKLIVAKGVDLLLAAWPLVLERVPGARLVIVGFGAYRDGLERLAAALGSGDEAGARALAAAGRAEEGGPAGELRYLAAFLDGLAGERREAYFQAARALSGSVTFTGRLEHEDLADLLPAVEAQVVPSTFPEAFGMVAAEAAVCGALPISAGHSGLAEVSEALAAAVPPEAAPAVLPAVRAGGGGPCRAPRGLAGSARAAAGRHPRGAGGRGPRALFMGGRGPRGDRGRPGAPGRAARP